MNECFSIRGNLSSPIIQTSTSSRANHPLFWFAFRNAHAGTSCFYRLCTSTDAGTLRSALPDSQLHDFPHLTFTCNIFSHGALIFYWQHSFSLINFIPFVKSDKLFPIFADDQLCITNADTRINEKRYVLNTRMMNRAHPVHAFELCIGSRADAPLFHILFLLLFAVDELLLRSCITSLKSAFFNRTHGILCFYRTRGISSSAIFIKDLLRKTHLFKMEHKIISTDILYKLLHLVWMQVEARRRATRES